MVRTFGLAHQATDLRTGGVTDVYQKIHNFLPIRILVAHKGIGKSAVFRMSYLENLKDNVLSIWVKPDDILRLANAGDDVDPLELIRQWKSGLEELLVEKIISNFNISNENDVINQVSSKGLKLAERIGLIVKKVQDVVDVDEIKSQIEGLNHINNVLDIHLWSLDGIDSILTLKINIDDVNNGDEVKKEIYIIASKYHIVDTTVEFR